MRPIAIVATHPIQYQAPLYQYLSAHRLPIHVLFLSDQGLRERHDVNFGRSFAWDIPLTEGYSHEFLPNLRRGAGRCFFDLVNPSVVSRLQGGDFSAVVLHGYRSCSMLMALAGARLGRLPVLYRSDTNGLRSGGIKKQLLGTAFRSVITACLSIGSLNDAFYSSLGVPAERRFLVPYSVDNERFQRDAAAFSQQDARSKLGLRPVGQVVLYAGKLVPWKQPDLLLRAFAEAAPRDSHLVFAGDGVMRPELEHWSESYVPGRVTYLGFMNQSEIPIAYRAADLLVLPSRHEPWGLVVNEVMNFGVPVLVSDRVGCRPDLVSPGVTGDIFQSGDRSSLERALNGLLEDPDRLKGMGDQALARIQRWGFPQAEAGLRAAVQALGIS